MLQTGRPGRRQRLISNGETQNEIEFPIQVDYNEEKSGVKKKGEEVSEDEIQEVVFLLGQLFYFFPGQGGRWQGRSSWAASGANWSGGSCLPVQGSQ